MLLLMPVLLLIVLVVCWFAPALEVRLFGQPLFQWMDGNFVQRNALIPLIFSLAEDALFNVPTRLSQGSLALAATPWQTLWHVVLPMAVPAMLTGLILAVARAAGETAPLMLVGVVKSVPVLPVDDIFPYLHLERKFMHLGFQIYDLAFQSADVEAARPLVYLTALLLVVIVVGLNVAAMGLRHVLREKYRALTL